MPLNAATARFVVAVTGGIGSGKSALADMLHALGAGLVDTDAISRDLTVRGGAAIEVLRREFGDAFITAQGALDRVAMRRLVFADASAKARLEGVLHPMIRAEVDRRLAAAGGPYVVLVVPLLVESGFYRSRADRVLVVDCPEELQVRRVVARDRLTEDEVRAIMARQASREQRRAAADDVVDNAGDLVVLERAAAALHATYCAAAADKVAAARRAR